MSPARRAVFFDVGDTLVRRPTVGPGRRIAEALALPAERARAITRLVFSEPFVSPAALAERLRGAFGLGVEIEGPLAAIWHAQEVEPVEVPGATACVAAVRKAGAWIGVVSNIWAPYEAGFRRACPAIVPLVDSWHMSYQIGAAKPDPALFRVALEAARVPAACAIMVGDSMEKDVLPALAFGMTAVWVLPETTDGDGVTVGVAANGATAASSGGAASPARPPAGCIVARGLAKAEELLLAALAAAGPSWETLSEADRE